ncbi:MAG: hypothetical protein IT326_05835 [Anaerolineae bacterium]|nr:hypothetical protein [Anaerolineae bacterium]
MTTSIQRSIRRILTAAWVAIIVVVALPTQAVFAQQAPVGQWYAEYFDGTDLAGPVKNTEYLPGPFLNYALPSESHPSGTVSSVGWSARFTTRATFQQGYYKFLIRVDDGARMYLNGRLAFDASGGSGTTYAARVLPMPAGTVTITVEYFEADGDNYVEARWEPTTDLPGEQDRSFTVPGFAAPTTSGGAPAGPSAAVQPAVSASAANVSGAAPGQWVAQYFDGTELTGAVRSSEVLPGTFLKYELPSESHPSGTSSAVDWSARFTTVALFEKGNYKFIIRADDAARVYINGRLAFDASGGTETVYASKVLPMPAGSFTIRVDYWEYDGDNYVELFWQKTTDLPGELDRDFVPPGSSVLPATTTGSTPSGGSVTPVTPSTAGSTGVASTPPSGGIFVDDVAPGFTWSGSQAWESGRGGLLNNQYTYTDNSRFGLRMWGRWNVLIPQTGNYNVYVYIPNHPGATSNARYRVFHAGVLGPVVTVDQGANTGQWVLLGKYLFNRNATQYVYLNDLTFETSGTRDVLFDAVQFVYAGQ